MALGAEAGALPWLGSSVVEVGVDGAPRRLLLDTGFPGTALGPGTGAAPERRLTLAGATAQVRPQLFLGGEGLDGVVGADVLHQLPLGFDARGRFVLVGPRFEQGAEGVAVEVVDLCRGSGSRTPVLVVEAVVEGQVGKFVLDTGAEHSWVSSAVAEGLGGRDRLSGVGVSSGFAGAFLAEAVRVRALSVGAAEAERIPVLTAPEVDEELARLSSLVEPGCPRCVPLRGFLGWSFLREFHLDLGLGTAAATGRRLRLTRFPAQDHWSRDFVGLGLRWLRVDGGLRVEGFYSKSPARAAGVLEGDLLVRIDGVSATQAPRPVGVAGQKVALELERAGVGAVSLTCEVADLLGDPQ